MSVPEDQKRQDYTKQHQTEKQRQIVDGETTKLLDMSTVGSTVSATYNTHRAVAVAVAGAVVVELKM